MFSLICIVFILSGLQKGFGEDVNVTLDKPCYDNGSNMTLTAVYKGSDGISAVIWYFSGRELQNIIIDTGCLEFQSDAGFPNPRLQYKCPPNTADSNTYQLILTSLEASDLDRPWGATFQVSAPSNPTLVTVEPTTCQTPAPAAPGTAAPGTDGGCDAGCIAGICVGVVFLLFIIGCIVGCVKAALVEDEDNFKWILLSCIIIVGLGILTVMGIRRCLNKCKEDAGKKDNSAAKPGAHSVNPHSNQATTVTLKNEHKDHGSKVRPQPSPPGGAKGTSVMHGREGSDGAVSREDVEMQESDSHFTKRPMPAIPPARDSKGRGLSANFEDTDHPLENIDTPAQRKGALEVVLICH